MTVGYAQHGAIAVLTVDNPPVNALSVAVRQGLIDGIRRAVGDPAITAIVLIGQGKTFIAGADIREFGKKPQPPRLTAAIAEIEASPKPVVAAIEGVALGGGLEVALGCHFRIGTKRSQVGLSKTHAEAAGADCRLERASG